MAEGRDEEGNRLSRLDSFIRRLTAQRACLNQAFEMISGLEGIVVELGLGNGRTYSHLRENLAGRRIIVFERDPKAHKDSTPEASDLIIGNLQETLPKAARALNGQVLLLHSDIGCGDKEIDNSNAQLIARYLPALIKPQGIVLSDQKLSCNEFAACALPEGIASGRYTFLRRCES